MARKSTRKQRPPSDKNGGNGRRRFGALATAWALLVLSLAGVVGWLALTPPPTPTPTTVEDRTAETAPQPPPAATPTPEPAPEAAPQTAKTQPAPPDQAAEDATGEATEAAMPRPVEDGQPAAPAAPAAPPRTAAATPEPAAEPEPAPAAQSAPEPPAAAPKAQPPAPAPRPAPAVQPEPTPSPAPDTRVALAPAPDPALIDRTAKGLLPIIGPDGRQPWQVYSRPFNAGTDTPRIAILIVGLGLSQSATNAAIQQLPGPVTLGFAPYAQDLQHWIEQSRAAGHEVILQLPMEPYDYPRNDPGPHTLLTSLQDAQNIERLEWLLSRFTGYVGVTNFQGAKFTTSERHLKPIMNVLGDRGLMFLDLRATEQSAAARVARDSGVPRALNNRFLDSTASRSAIDARLNELERIARLTGTAVGVGFAYPVTIERVANWAPTLALKGIALAPITATVNRQEVR